MKKIVSLILLVMLLTASFACAEEFTLHNGTKFGLTREEVKSIESENGVILKGEGRSLEAKTTIANQSNSNLAYFFDDNVLTLMSYSFPGIDSYQTIEQGLTEKYGNTEYSSITGKSFPVIEDVFEPFDDFVQTDGHNGEFKYVYNVMDYSHRLIQISENEYAFIEHYTYTMQMYDPYFKYNPMYYHYVRYHYVTEETAQLIQNTFQKGNADL